MKRDMDVVRKMLFAVRDAPTVVNGVEGVSKEDFAYHAQLLDEAGLVCAAIQGNGKRIASDAVIFRLTWAGEDFAASIKDDTIWNKAKTNVLKPSASWTFGVLLKYLEGEITRRIDQFL